MHWWSSTVMVRHNSVNYTTLPVTSQAGRAMNLGATAGIVMMSAVLWSVVASSVIAGKNPLKVFVSIPPQEYFVERIAGERACVQVLVGQGQSPHVFEPTPQHLARMCSADLYFTIGLPFEKRLVKKISGITSHLTVVNTAQGISLREDAGHDEHHHDSGQGDPHIWLAPALIKQQAATMCAALCHHDPESAAYYRDNLSRFHAELDALDSEIKIKLAPFAGKEIFVFHPAFGYITDTGGLRQTAIEVQGKEPGAQSLTALIDRARKQRVKVLFAERQFSAKTSEAVARQLGAEVIILDPLAKDCFENLRFITDRFVYAFRKSSEE